MAYHEAKDWEIRYDEAQKYAGDWGELVWNSPLFNEKEQIKVDPIEAWVERWISELGTIE